jgi:hypothetical protein
VSGVERVTIARRAIVTRYGPGTAPTAWHPGDFILTHTDSWQGRLIRAGQRIGLRGSERRFALWDHAALVVSEQGDLVEAIGGRGVIRTCASRHLFREYRLVHIEADDQARRHAVRVACWVADNRTRYGWLAIVSIGCLYLTGGRFAVHLDRQVICSGLVAETLHRAGAAVVPGPSHVTPADLARAFIVEPPRLAAPAAG